MTKDERFLIEVYKAKLAGQESVDPAQIAKKLGYKANLTKEILKGLQQANFVKALSPEELIITEHGEELARSLQP